MQWQTSPEGWSATIDEHSEAQILLRSRKGFAIWKVTLRGKSGSIVSAQARVEAIVDQLGVEAEGLKAGAEIRQPGADVNFGRARPRQAARPVGALRERSPWCVLTLQ